MIHNFLVPGFVSAGTLALKVSRKEGIYNMVADLAVMPKSADWSSYTQSPASVPLAEDTYVVLKAGAGDMPAAVAYSWSGVWQRATVLEQRVVLVPVRYDAETLAQTLSLTDGVTDTDISVTARDVTQTAGTFAISTVWKNTLYSMGGQLIAVEGTGMNNVARVTDSEGNELTVVNVDDTWLVVTMAAIATPGAITLSFRNAGDTVIGTNVVTVAGSNEIEGEAFYWYSNDVVTALIDGDDAVAFIAYGGSEYGPSQGAYDLVTDLNLKENAFVRIVRDRNGAILPYCAYSVMSINGSTLFTGQADESGIISLSISTLPSNFIIEYNSFSVPLRREFVAL